MNLIEYSNSGNLSALADRFALYSLGLKDQKPQEVEQFIGRVIAGSRANLNQRAAKMRIAPDEVVLSFFAGKKNLRPENAALQMAFLVAKSNVHPGLTSMGRLFEAYRNPNKLEDLSLSASGSNERRRIWNRLAEYHVLEPEKIVEYFSKENLALLAYRARSFASTSARENANLFDLSSTVHEMQKDPKAGKSPVEAMSCVEQLKLLDTLTARATEMWKGESNGTVANAPSGNLFLLKLSFLAANVALATGDGLLSQASGIAVKAFVEAMKRPLNLIEQPEPLGVPTCEDFGKLDKLLVRVGVLDVSAPKRQKYNDKID